MNKKIKEFLIDNGLPLPETILYPPLDKINGYKLVRYEIDSSGMVAFMHYGCEEHGYIGFTWTLERVKQCTWR